MNYHLAALKQGSIFHISTGISVTFPFSNLRVQNQGNVVHIFRENFFIPIQFFPVLNEANVALCLPTDFEMLRILKVLALKTGALPNFAVGLPPVITPFQNGFEKIHRMNFKFEEIEKTEE